MRERSFLIRKSAWSLCRVIWVKKNHVRVPVGYNILNQLKESETNTSCTTFAHLTHCFRVQEFSQSHTSPTNIDQSVLDCD